MLMPPLRRGGCDIKKTAQPPPSVSRGLIHISSPATLSTATVFSGDERAWEQRFRVF